MVVRFPSVKHLFIAIGQIVSFYERLNSLPSIESEVSIESEFRSEFQSQRNLLGTEVRNVFL